MLPLLSFVLLRLGVCRNFPRAIIFAPLAWFGMGIKHLFTMQEITQLKELIHHISTQSVTGQLYSASWELLHIELGSHSIIPKEHFALYEALPVTFNVKNSWDFYP
jgi:hypothetical protein